MSWDVTLLDGVDQQAQVTIGRGYIRLTTARRARSARWLGQSARITEKDARSIATWLGETSEGSRAHVILGVASTLARCLESSTMNWDDVKRIMDGHQAAQWQSVSSS